MTSSRCQTAQASIAHALVPPTDELMSIGAPASLRDGSRVRIRQGRQSDGELQLRAFDHLSPESRYRRFLAPPGALSRALLRYLTEVDHHDHKSILALNEEGTAGLGIARYVRHVSRPDAAEVAVTVIDDWQGRGLGTLLLEAICARARAEAIRTFTALMLTENHEMLDLLKRLGPVRSINRACGTVEIEVPIPPAGAPPALGELLRVTALHDVVVPRAIEPTRQALAEIGKCPAELAPVSQ